MASLELNKQSCPEHVLKWIENGGQIHYVTSLHRQSTASFNYQKVYENSSESRLVSFGFLNVLSYLNLEHMSKAFLSYHFEYIYQPIVLQPILQYPVLHLVLHSVLHLVLHLNVIQLYL